MKKRTLMTLALTAALGLALAAAPAVKADGKKLLYVHGASDTSILQTTAEYFAQQVEENGMEFIDLDEATLAELKEKAQPVYDSVREQVGDETMDSFLAAIESVTAK